MINEYLESGSWFNRSRRGLIAAAIATAAGFILFCAATEFFVAQYFVCVTGCRAGTPPLLLIAVSSFFALIPTVGTGVIGYWIARGLWDDARQQGATQSLKQKTGSTFAPPASR